MTEATPPTLAARNAFGVLLIVLMVLFVYQAVAVIESDLVIEFLFYLAASVYLVSLYYYRRGDGDTGDIEAEEAGDAGYAGDAKEAEEVRGAEEAGETGRIREAEETGEIKETEETESGSTPDQR